MTTGRRPRSDPGDFAVRPRTFPGRAVPPDTVDDLVPSTTSSAEIDAAEIRDPYFDAPRGHPLAPETRDIHDRIAALEAALPSAEKNARWIRLGVRVLSGLLGLGAAVLVYALALSRSAGDAEGEKRARDIERARYIAIIDQLVRDVARHDGTITSLIEAIRTRYPIGALPLQGPPPEPSPQDAPP